jgi:hypothetical protein
MDSLRKTGASERWEQLITSLLRRLELDPKDRAAAERDYLELAESIASKLGIGREDVEIDSQGSMRTQTTIRPSRNAKFDLDVIVKFSGPAYSDPDPEEFFAEFGRALDGNESQTGEPEPRRRCWKLQFPNKPYYFDITPAVADVHRLYGACLRVRDPKTGWSPSNPKEFAEWFCTKAQLRFTFPTATRGLDGLVEGRKSIAPLPNGPVGIDDILRRTIQLLKLHRDNFYFFASEEQKSTMPISVIIVTLATRAFEQVWLTRRNAFSSPIDVVLAVVEEMPNYIHRNAQGGYQVLNPELPTENFADRWNDDKGVRAREFRRWHVQLESHLEALLTDDYAASTEVKLRSVFGQDGVDAWRDSLGLSAGTSSPLLKSLAVMSQSRAPNPTTVTPIGCKTNTLA